MRESWEIRELGKVCKFFRGLTYSKEDEVEKSSKKVLRSNNIDLESNTLVLEEMKYLREDFDIEDDKIVKSNSILICMSNGSKQHIGKVAFIKEPIDYAFGGFMGLIFPDKSICAKYIYYACTSSLFKHFILGIGNGIGITNLRFTDLSNFTLPVPPFSEQERIVAELDCLSSIIEKQKEQLNELDNLAQSIFYTMFGDPIANEKGWEVKKLGDICASKKEIARASKRYMETDTIHYIDISSIDNKTNVITETTPYIFAEAPSRAQQVVEIGDILVSLVRPNLQNIAMITLQDSKLVASSGFCVLRAGEKSNTRFIKHLAISERFTAYLMERVSGANYPAVREDDIRDCMIGVPPISYQQEFASKIKMIEKQKELIKQSIAETEMLFNSRMDYYFN